MKQHLLAGAPAPWHNVGSGSTCAVSSVMPFTHKESPAIFEEGGASHFLDVHPWFKG